MSATYPGILRHVLFGDTANPGTIYIIPENEVYFKLHKVGLRVNMIAIFQGRTITLPPGSAAQYIQIQAITEQGGVGYPSDAVFDEDVSAPIPFPSGKQ